VTDGHIPVLLDEAVSALAIRADGTYVDATFGRGGHARAILAALGSHGRLVALDRDPDAEAAARAIADPRFVFHRAWFSQLPAVLDALSIPHVDGVLFDLGISSPQIDVPARGFSFRSDGPLDMRMDPSRGESAAEFVARATRNELAKVIRDHGEERLLNRLQAQLLRRGRGSPSSPRGNWPPPSRKPSARARGVIGVRIRPRARSRPFGFS
jgi:16S rRNA (cytosine1402-N4)-methyltransferase